MMPGKVISKHEKYEKECNNCHESFSKKTQTRLCRKCHKKVDVDIVRKKGYHGRIRNINKIECKVCHTDHKGRNKDIVKLNKQTFNHNKTDFALKSKHRSVSCLSCHKKTELYRKAPATCYSCHKKTDIHKGKLGKKCQQCHNEKSWGKSRFDHDKTDFKLIGAHKDTDCNSCHINQQYKKTPDKCYQCHITKDVHAGNFGNKCNSCHRSTKWKKIFFNHHKETKYALKGKHIKISCYACHKKNPYKNDTPKKCYNCHKTSDIHQGIFGKKCTACHTEKNWTTTRFKHNRDTDYKLYFKHSKTDCNHCHRTNPYNSKTLRTCYSCHKKDDVHKDSQGKQCQDCHSEKSWKEKVAFDHDLSKFPLIGLHASVACEECHIDSNYRKTPSKCIDCHAEKDIHKKQFGNKCQQCHNPNAWQRWTFDHNKQTEFKLMDSHADLECHACHLLEKKPDSLDSSCNSCHARDDIHNGGFGIQCERCHSQDSFSNIHMIR